ncbi:slipin family protein [Curtanaerobium respiraculi]|jgi:regulator of protease activity HflC (stomatin/prohibitin superfamily)|uniref:slipin family protein n=1 Tax=Curtanaerobium respiraculi TaxID=2949669 RepID=UPI0024B3B509|nr:slipin family protein [Curtanaerobium respiraculi]
MKNRDRKPSGSRRSERREATAIEAYNTPHIRRASRNTRPIFSSFLFVVVLIAVCGAAYLSTGTVDIFALSAGMLLGMLASSTIRIAAEWEKAVVLRLGGYSRTAGPGVFFTIPFIDHVALWADQRVMLTGFNAEETLTADLVPVNVDAVLFWTVFDPQRACIEVEDYYDSVALAAQTALRDAIGRRELSEVATSRVQLDEELQDAIDEKAAAWGISVISVEIRDVVIPKDLQSAMAAEATAAREKEARIVLADVERDIASMLHQASSIYSKDATAFELRKLHLLNEGVKDSNGTIVVPSPYAEGFNQGKSDQIS